MPELMYKKQRTDAGAGGWCYQCASGSSRLRDAPAISAKPPLKSIANSHVVVEAAPPARIHIYGRHVAHSDTCVVSCYRSTRGAMYLLCFERAEAVYARDLFTIFRAC